MQSSAILVVVACLALAVSVNACPQSTLFPLATPLPACDFVSPRTLLSRLLGDGADTDDTVNPLARTHIDAAPGFIILEVMPNAHPFLMGPAATMYEVVSVGAGPWKGMLPVGSWVELTVACRAVGVSRKECETITLSDDKTFLAVQPGAILGTFQLLTKATKVDLP